jgi:Mrp family chromosome partitioning ATPase
MVTSARPGEGKTLTAANFAGSVALQGDHQVLLIDIRSLFQLLPS